MENYLPDKPDDAKKNSSSDLSAEAGNSLDHQDFQGQDPKTLPYWNDLDFQKILSAYQKAEWDFCLKGIDQFQKLYPGDNYLHSFRKEVELRSDLYVKRERQRGKERRTELGKKWGWIIIVFIVAVLTGLGFFQYQNSALKKQQAIETASLIYSLDVKFQNAENLMQAGKPEDALILYIEIQRVDSSYNEIELRIEQAEAAIVIENLYQEGVLEQTAGHLDLALSTFVQIDSLSPNYKDTDYRIDEIRVQQQINFLHTAIEDAYSAQDWKAVATAYESIQQLDPNFMLSEEEKELLFISLYNLVIQTVDEDNSSLEEIESAVRYYKLAMALYPQNKKFTEEREDLHITNADLLINKYYVYAVNSLEESNFTYQSLTQAIQILTQVISIGGGSETITEEFKTIKLFLDSYNQFLNEKYELAIRGFEELKKNDANYASGKVNYLLYESYLAYGDILYNNADYTGARDQYLEADRYAWMGSDHILRVFCVKLKFARVLNKLLDPSDAASYYQYAFGLIHYRQRLLDTDNQDLLSLIDNANAAFANQQIREAITLYEMAVEEKDRLFDYGTEDVFNGDALPDIAYQYGCTIEILKSTNMLGDSLFIQSDQDLLIPIN